MIIINTTDSSVTYSKRPAPSRADTRTKRLLPCIPGFAVKKSSAVGFDSRRCSYLFPLALILTIPETTHMLFSFAAFKHVSRWLFSHSSSSSRNATKQSCPKDASAESIPLFQLPVPELPRVLLLGIRRTFFRSSASKQLLMWSSLENLWMGHYLKRR